MAAVENEAEWKMWTTPAFDPVYNTCVAPWEVIMYPLSKGHLRPLTMPVINCYTYISHSLFPSFQKLRPGYPHEDKYKLYEERPPSWIVGFLPADNWTPKVIIRLEALEGSSTCDLP